MKGKERKGMSILYSAILVRTHTLKALRHGSHSFTCKQHHACLSFVSVHQMAPPQLTCVFSGTLNPTQSVNQWSCITYRIRVYFNN